MTAARLRHRAPRDRGAALIEFAIVLPLLIVLVFGLIEFGRAYTTKVTLTHAAREGVRELVITRDPDAAEATAIAAASAALDAAQITVASTSCTPGQPTELTVSYPFSYDIPLFGSGAMTLSSKGVMRCGG